MAEIEKKIWENDFLFFEKLRTQWLWKFFICITKSGRVNNNEKAYVSVFAN